MYAASYPVLIFRIWFERTGVSWACRSSLLLTVGVLPPSPPSASEGRPHTAGEWWAHLTLKVIPPDVDDARRPPRGAPRGRAGEPLSAGPPPPGTSLTLVAHRVSPLRRMLGSHSGASQST
ncbi:hypothetical protein E2C01_098645 [Portunus trituberculatus]|uniref:Uncharacterized protein n=1 Tax=Portunus trituberculatus TaxID=210409 RepID=A0A5B7K7H4_PORTR|nr:hypothetical protein [Portunus trituberculatus]